MYQRGTLIDRPEENKDDDNDAQGFTFERWHKLTICIKKIERNRINSIAQSAGAVEYTDCTSAEG